MYKSLEGSILGSLDLSKCMDLKAESQVSATAAADITENTNIQFCLSIYCKKLSGNFTKKGIPFLNKNV